MVARGTNMYTMHKVYGKLEMNNKKCQDLVGKSGTKPVKQVQ